jgi:hypothetical protein
MKKCLTKYILTFTLTVEIHTLPLTPVNHWFSSAMIHYGWLRKADIPGRPQQRDEKIECGTIIFNN